MTAVDGSVTSATPVEGGGSCPVRDRGCATVGERRVIDGATGPVLAARRGWTQPVTAGPHHGRHGVCGRRRPGRHGAALRGMCGRVPSRPLRMVYCDVVRNDIAEPFRSVPATEQLDGIAVPPVFGAATSFHRPVVPPGALGREVRRGCRRTSARAPWGFRGGQHGSGGVRLSGRPGGRRPAGAGAGGGEISGVDGEGRFQGAAGGVGMVDLVGALRAGLRDGGVIRAQEHAAAGFPQRGRTAAGVTGAVPGRGGAGAGRAWCRSRRDPGGAPPARRGPGEHGGAARLVHGSVQTLCPWSGAAGAARPGVSVHGGRTRGISGGVHDSHPSRVRITPDGRAAGGVRRRPAAKGRGRAGVGAMPGSAGASAAEGPVSCRMRWSGWLPTWP